MEKIVRVLQEQLSAGKSSVLVTIIAQSGSTPRGVGTQMLVGTEGILAGTVGGGAIEAQAITRGRALAVEKKSEVIRYDLSGENKTDLGMVCGGGVTLFFCPLCPDDSVLRSLTAELFLSLKDNRPGFLLQCLSDGALSLLDENGNVLAGQEVNVTVQNVGFGGMKQDDYFILPLAVRQRVIVCGGGHVAQCLVPVLAGVDFRVIVVESRPEFARQELFPQAEKVLLVDYTDLSASVDLRPDDFVVIMTHGHVHDYTLQEQLLRKEYAYIGVMGSKRKIASVNERLAAAGISREAMEKVHTPIGVAIGAATPAEIAISVAAECIAVRAQRGKMTGDACPSTL